MIQPIHLGDFMTSNRAFGELGGVKLALLLAILVLPPLAYGALSYACPCDRTPGGYLLGPEASEPVSDWSFANQVPLCQLQVGRLLPHSINLNCMSTEGQLYLSCSECEGKRWSGIALSQPDARIRVDDSIHLVTVTRVTEAESLDRAWRARADKIGADASQPRPAGWWSFQVQSR
jgi:hypothetical protein